MTRPPAGATIVVLGSYGPSLVMFRGPLIEGLAARGYKVVAMAGKIDKDTRARLTALGAEAKAVPLVNNSMNPLSMAQSVKALTAAFREVAPAAVIAYTVKPVTLGAIAAARAGIGNFVALVTGLGFAFTEGRGLKRGVSRVAATWLYRLAFRLSRTIIFQNPDDRADFQRRGILPKKPEPVIVNGSGIDLDRFRPGPVPAAPIFLMISRLLGDKGVREYGEAVRRLKARHPQASFRLVGYFDQSPDTISE